MKNVNSSYDSMALIPASLQLDDIEIELTATHQGNAIQSEWNKRILICRWIEETGIDEDYDYIIFDCPPATKIVSQNAIAASHGYVVPVVPEAVMERGAPHLVDMMKSGIDAKLKALVPFGESRAFHVPDTGLIGLVITRIQTHGTTYSGYTNDHTQHLRTLETFWRNALIRPFIPQGVGVSEALTRGVLFITCGEPGNVGRRQIDKIYSDVTDEIKSRIDAL